jgi:serine/threonine-protein kinase HipA
MNPEEIKYCPGTLAEGFSTYSPTALRNMFYGKKVNHILDIDAPEFDEEVAEKFRQNAKIISVSGAHFKQSLLLDKNKLRLTQASEPGQYILKPIPVSPSFGKAEELPANEHLTMQIAKQVYGIVTAECALIFFKSGEPAYITRRFDVNADGIKTHQEDFASLSEKSKINDENYRSSGSYEDIARLMKKFVGAYDVEVEKYFERIVFNYLFSNGDAHLKNFSLQQAASGDYLLSPAYDLLDTTIHIPADTFFALLDGLFSDDYETKSFKALGYYAYDDFYEFGLKLGLMQSRLEKMLNKYRIENVKVKTMTQRSFLSEPVKDLFLKHYAERVKMLNNSYSGKLIA